MELLPSEILSWINDSHKFMNSGIFQAKNLSCILKWFIAVWFLYPSFTAHCTESIVLNWGVKATNHNPWIIITITYTLTMAIWEQWGVIFMCFSYHTKRIHILIFDLWLIVKKHFYVLSSLSHSFSDPFWWFLHEKCTLKCHNKLWDSQLHPSNKSAPRFLCIFISFSHASCFRAAMMMPLKRKLQFTQAQKTKIYGFN